MKISKNLKDIYTRSQDGDPVAYNSEFTHDYHEGRFYWENPQVIYFNNQKEFEKHLAQFYLENSTKLMDKYTFILTLRHDHVGFISLGHIKGEIC